MSRLLKAAAVQWGAERKSIRTTPSIGNSPAIDGALATSEASALDEALSQLATLQQAHDELQHCLEAREQAAFKQGKTEGLSEGTAKVTRLYDEQLASLKDGLRAARDGFQARLQTLESLAIDMTQTALGRLFGDGALRQELVLATIRRHLREIAADTLIRVDVSKEDFPDAVQTSGAWQALMDAGLPEIRIVSALSSGACTIQLTLGRLEVGLPQQWEALTAALNGLRADD